MSKVLFMLNRIPTNFNKLILLRNITINSKALINNQVKKQSLKNNSIILLNTRRYLAQQQQNQPQLDKNELDKPQWERSDRYVNLNRNLININFEVYLTKNSREFIMVSISTMKQKIK